MIPAAAAAFALAAAGPAPLHPGDVLWRDAGAELRVGSCAGWPEPGLDCKTLDLRTAGEPPRVLSRNNSYVVRLWTRPAGVDGPAVMAAASGGGTNGCLDVFAVDIAADRVLRVQALHPCHSDTPMVGVLDGRAVTELRLDLGGLAFSGSNASTASIPVPAVWREGRFTLDQAAVARRSLGEEDAALRRAAVQDSLYEFKNRSEGGVAGDGAGLAVQALAGLMLDGRAAEARELLHAAWPWDMHGAREPGEARFWSELCRGVLQHRLWRELDLDQLPQADVIRAGAAGG